MSVAAPKPIIDAHGLPLCNQDGCGLYDGKRCSAMGFKPDRFCEPALIDLAAEHKTLKADMARVVELERKRHPLFRVTAEGFTPVSCDRERTGEWPCPGCGAAARRPCTTTPAGGCRHTRRSLRPDLHGNPVTTCIDCGDEIP